MVPPLMFSLAKSPRPAPGTDDSLTSTERMRLRLNRSAKSGCPIWAILPRAAAITGRQASSSSLQSPPAAARAEEEEEEWVWGRGCTCQADPCRGARRRKRRRRR